MHANPKIASLVWKRLLPTAAEGKGHRRNFTIKLGEFWRNAGKLPTKSKSYDIVKLGNVSGRQKVPAHIALPPYCASVHPDGGENVTRSRRPEIKTCEQVDRMRDAGKLARKMMNIAVQHSKVGVTTDDIDAVVHEAIVDHGAYPSPLLYHGFPKSICTSVNNVVCHGIPDDRPLKDGDIISIDITVYLNGYHGDCAETVTVGTVDDAGLRLIETARTCRDAGIEACGAGKSFSNIGAMIRSTSVQLNSTGFKIIPTFCGHGIGSYFHGPPDIFHFANHLRGNMETGMTFTIEPVISEGSERFVILDDGWTAATVDHSRGAQFEHTILIGDSGVELLTT